MKKITIDVTACDLVVIQEAMKYFLEKRGWTGVGTKEAASLHDRAKDALMSYNREMIRRIEIDGEQALLIRKGGRKNG